jgi:ubiquinone/menaquinone biosynthesis C-methylase UbiE/uncharacterized protein YbaR (Trm112 family)
MHEQVADFLACPICRTSLVFEGERANNRFVSGYFKCGNGHVYQVKDEIGLFKDMKVSAKEFKWEVDVADEEKYDEIRKQYYFYFEKDQKIAMQKMVDKLVGYVAASCAESLNVVLDVATGMGTFILPLIEECSDDALVIGTDIDERPLRGVMNKARKACTYHKLSLVVTDAKHLSFKNSTFSTISSYFGFDNVPDTASAFKESARVLQIGGHMFFSSLWVKENSESMRLAERHGVCQIASECRLKKVLRKAGLILERVEEIYCGVWPHNPMDLLPVEGDEYVHVIVQAKKPRG